MNCPRCHQVIFLQDMNPIYAPQYESHIQPIHEKFYGCLTIKENGIPMLTARNARLIIYNEDSFQANQQDLTSVNILLAMTQVIIHTNTCTNFIIFSLFPVPDLS